ncbi:MAG: hypothetical protein E5X34_26985 [Mesorhizobium sp.]|uniref:hypothetical protein n=1 Tax=Mesorhizobium sp. TaxID=1871066 RepID=UPI001208ED28|nr:hypothetical protein [Mesorhizobium sp.]TIR15965.1 MAG: hypothetical protein E5X34_26985 [Mesorhizobium sp.]
MALNLHPADVSDLEKIAGAKSFAAHLRTGPHDKIVKRAKTLAAVIRAADALGKTPSGRKALIYAITADKQSIHVPADMIAQARKEGATAPRSGPGKATGAPKAGSGAPKAGGRAASALEAAQRGECQPRPISAPRRTSASGESSRSSSPSSRSAMPPV